MPEDEPKSAYEIAMETLRRKDREEGREASAPLTDRQKEKIAEIRREYEAKAAEMEIMHRANLRKAMADPEEVKKIEESYREERRRAENEKESRIAKIRRG